MSPYFRVLRIGLVGLTILGVISGATSGGAQSVTAEETVRSVRRMLERLPYYGVFDYIVFRVNRGTVYLAGYGFEGRLKADAEMAAKRASGWLLIFYKRQRHEGRRGDASHFLSVTAWWRAFDAPLEWLAPPAHICRAYVDPERGRRMTPAARQACAARSRQPVTLEGGHKSNPRNGPHPSGWARKSAIVVDQEDIDEHVRRSKH